MSLFCHLFLSFISLPTSLYLCLSLHLSLHSTWLCVSVWVCLCVSLQEAELAARILLDRGQVIAWDSAVGGVGGGGGEGALLSPW